MASQPLLSIGMIVKNESRCLEKCLKALEPLRNATECELIIADTGSTDNTKEIAQRFADTLFDFEWVNDFSKARNAVMDRAKGKWFMTLDADEYLESSPDELVSLVTNEDNLKYSCATFVKRNYASVTLQGLYNDFAAIRIVRLTPEVRYTGTIHEKLTSIDLGKCVTLSNTIFAHDGYATIDADLSKQKAERNLKLLEEEYKKKPNDATVILQLIESSHVSKKERYEKALLGMNFIASLNKNSGDFKHVAPAIARKALQHAVEDGFSQTEEWFKWTKENLSDSFFTLVDVSYLYTQWLFLNGDFTSAVESGKIYFENLKKFQQKENKTIESMISSILFSHKIYQQNLALVIAKSAVENGNNETAVQYLKATDITSASPEAVVDLMTVVSRLDTDNAKVVLKEFSQLFNDEMRSLVKDFFFNEFSCDNPESERLEKYTVLNNFIGLSAKIVTAKNDKEIKNIFEKAESLNDILPLAFYKALRCDFSLPERFYQISSENLQKLFKNIFENSDNYEQIILKYSSEEFLSDFTRLAFTFNMLNAFWSSESHAEFNTLSQFRSSYLQSAKLLLTNLYNDEVLENPQNFGVLPKEHQFAIYYISAIEASDFKEKVASLRKAINVLPEMNPLVSFTTEEIKKEQQKIEKEKQLSASPELLALAKNIQALLSNYAPNDPALIAIKQSPVYKQVAHLLEN